MISTSIIISIQKGLWIIRLFANGFGARDDYCCLTD
jgi:hypothetical protein